MKMINFFTLTFTFSLVSLLNFVTPLYARNFQVHKIPGAKCASGLDYRIWIEIRDPKKLTVEFMGGGACWDRATCLGEKLRTWIFPIPKLPNPSTFSATNPNLSPVANDSYIFFPYCTGDVHSGQHIARYGLKKIYHYGRKNVELTLKYLLEKNLINFSELDRFTLYGASAGAIGSLANLPLFEEILPPHTQRKLVSDSPGLHFGKTFWQKFPNRYFEDLKNAFSPLITLDKNDGFIAPQIRNICQKLSNWDIGIMQSSQDIVMSRVFGEISARDHEKLVFSQEGLANITNNIDNCHVHIPKGPWHTFYLLPFTTQLPNSTQSQTRDFAFDELTNETDEQIIQRQEKIKEFVFNLFQ